MKLMKIFGPSTEKETGRGRKLYTKDLQDFLLIKCHSGHSSKVNTMGGYVTFIGGEQKCIHSFCGEA